MGSFEWAGEEGLICDQLERHRKRGYSRYIVGIRTVQHRIQEKGFYEHISFPSSRMLIATLQCLCGPLAQ